MRIKRLEVYGFKSFKDKTIIHFDAGITGVVGPNGCGKSNIVDAFFWSLGEQNPRLLRGLAMEDLIFSGSDKAPPANMAEVTLVLEVPAEIAGANAPAGASFRDLGSMTKEMAVTRRLYRSGDSEYFINKVPCRLRDIQELFMDTGVGSRSYSIIQQGMIGKIVQAKPEERRQMIEDVAGVVKYKKRRQESLRKLDSTRQNLLRVTDVVTEIEKQKRQMERQAEKAQKYRKWKTDLESSELKLNAYLWEENEEKLQSVNSELQKLNEEKLGAETVRETIETKVSAKRLEIEQAQKISDEFQNNCFKMGQELSEAQSEQKYKNQSVEDIQKAISEIEAESETEKNRLDSMQEQLDVIEIQAKEINDSYAAAKVHCEEVAEKTEAKKQEVEAKEVEYRELGGKLHRTNNDLNSVRNDILIARSKSEDLTKREHDLNEEKSKSDIELADVAQEKNVAQLALNKTDASREEKLTEKTDKNELVATTDAKARELQTEVNKLESELTRTQTELRSLEQQRDRHEGSGKGVQTIFKELLPKNDEWLNAVKGSLSDLIKVSEGKETAIEAYLGKQLDSIVIDNDEIAVKILRELKDSDKGRATFLREPESSQPALVIDHKHGLGEMRQFVEAQYVGLQPLLDYILADTYLCEDAAGAAALSAENRNFSFVTLDGEVFRHGRVIEGGAKIFDTSGAVQRNQRIDALSEEVQKIETSLRELQTELDDVRAANQTARDELVAIEASLSEINKMHTEQVANVATLNSRYESIKQRISSFDDNLAKIAGSREELANQENEAKSKESELSEQLAKYEHDYKQVEDVLPKMRLEYQEQQSLLTEARIKETSLLEQKNSSDMRLNQTRDNLSQTRDRIESLLNNAKSKASDLENTHARIAELSQKIEEYNEKLIGAEEEAREAKGKLDGLQAELDEMRKSADTASTREREITERSTDLRVKQDRFQNERDNIQGNTFERYGLEIAEYVMQAETKEQVAALKEEGQDAIDTLKNDVMRLRGKIQKLGGVNEAAIEEFEELTTRYEFLETQRKDLESAMKDLEKTIDKINKVSKERFGRAFEKVNNQFMQVFPALFGGGSAKLTLTDPDDLLETGVDIMAQPPGKKLQNINLLSGGEKTLTAISLLFAIFLVRPSPFCLLDEVDAPLDDANIGRFNALLKQMAKLSQFIIITHNKRTMELNDRLYGVTMEEAGVSKMVSIQMTA